MGKTPSVLITDTDRASAVAIIRSLGRRGWRVTAADSTPRSLGFRSRFVADRLVYPQPETDTRRFAETMYKAIVDREIELVIPVTDEVIHPLVEARARFENVCRLAIADTASLAQTTDKSKTVALAKGLGIPVPETRVVHSEEVARRAAASMRFPIVVKPAVSRRLDPKRGVIEKFSVSYANSLDELVDRVGLLRGCPKILLQEYCSGTGHGVELLAHEGRVIAAFQHRRLAEVPLTGGVSAWRESVPLTPELYDYSKRLVEALRWDGLIMVEFKVGRVSQLMEVNGRVWGSLPLAVASGMDFPALLAELYSGGPPQGEEPNTDYRVGVRTYDLELLLKWVLRVLLRRKVYPFLSIPKPREAFAGLAGLLSPRQKSDLNAREDRGLAVAELAKIARKWCRKARGTRGV